MGCSVIMISILRIYSMTSLTVRKFVTSLVIFSFGLPSTLLAANYSYLDPGDMFYVNDFGDNRHVVVVRKMGNGNVKVRNTTTGESFVIQATKLLTQAELEAEELGNAVVGTAVVGAVIFCLFTDECGK